MSATSTLTGEGEKAPRAVVRQSSITSVVALVGVLSGLALDLTWGRMFGAGDRSDAFALALRLPLAIAAIAMVVANQVLVPTFGQWMTRLERAERDRVVSALLLLSVLLSVGMAVLFTVFAHPLMSVMAPGFSDVPGKLELAAHLTRIVAWYIPCVVVAEVLRCWLNANLMIGFPAAMALVLNVVAVAVIVIGPKRIDMVPLGYVAGSLVQLLAMAVAAVMRGWRPAAPALGHPEVRATVRLFSRPLAGAALNPITRIVEVFFASSMPGGTTTILHFGNRLASAIGGTIIFRSIMVTVLPRLSRAFGRGDDAEFRSLTRLGLRLMFYLSVPMTLVGIVLAPPITELVFTGNKFKASAAATLGVVMALYAISFAGSGIQRSLLAPFYARRDTKTPLRNTVYGILANLVLLPPLIWVFDSPSRVHAVYAVPIAYSASQYVNVAHAYWRMRQVPSLGRVPMGRAFAGSLGCGLAGALAAWVVLRVAPSHPRPLAAALASLAGVLVSSVLCALAFRRRGTAGRQGNDSKPAIGGEPAHQPGPQQQTFAMGEQEDIHVETIDRHQVEPAPTRTSRVPVESSMLGTALTALLGIALTVYTAVGLFDGSARMTVALPIAIIVGLALLAVAIYDLETFVLVALAIRSSMDALRTPGSAPDPHILLGLMLLALGTWWLITRRLRLGRAFPMSRLGVAMLAFLVVAAIGVTTSESWSTSIFEWSRIANIVVVFLVIEQFAARGSSAKPFIAAIGLAIVVPAATALTQTLSGEGLFVAGGFSRITGTFDHSNPLAYFSVVVILLMAATYPVVHGMTRLGVAIVIAISGVLLLLTYTRSAWLVALIGVLVLIWRRRNYALVAVVIAAAILGTATPQVQARFADLETQAQVSGKPANSLAWRWEYWGEALDVAKPSPIAGVGLRTVAATTTEGKQPHNDIIRAYVELGIPGLLTYLFVLGMALWTGIVGARDARRRRLGGVDRAIAEAGLVVALSLVMLSFVANLMSQVVVTMYAFAVIGLSSGAYLRRRRIDAEADAADDRSARLARVART